MHLVLQCFPSTSKKPKKQQPFRFHGNLQVVDNKNFPISFYNSPNRFQSLSFRFEARKFKCWFWEFCSNNLMEIFDEFLEICYLSFSSNNILLDNQLVIQENSILMETNLVNWVTRFMSVYMPNWVMDLTYLQTFRRIHSIQSCFHKAFLRT